MGLVVKWLYGVELVLANASTVARLAGWQRRLALLGEARAPSGASGGVNVRGAHSCGSRLLLVLPAAHLPYQPLALVFHPQLFPSAFLTRGKLGGVAKLGSRVNGGALHLPPPATPPQSAPKNLLAPSSSALGSEASMCLFLLQVWYSSQVLCTSPRQAQKNPTSSLFLMPSGGRSSP